MKNIIKKPINQVVLYVKDVEKSAEFYKELLNTQILKSYPGFSLLALNDYTYLGLQAKDSITPISQEYVGGVELCLSNVNNEEVDEIYNIWKGKNVKILLEPTMLDFGYNCVAEDLDGYRIRICATDTSSFE